MTQPKIVDDKRLHRRRNPQQKKTHQPISHRLKMKRE